MSPSAGKSSAQPGRRRPDTRAAAVQNRPTTARHCRRMATAEITAAPLPGAEPVVNEGGDDHRPAVDVVVPVYNEQVALGPGIRRLHAYLSDRFPFTWRITIADN